jgi:hypothetical protein
MSEDILTEWQSFTEILFHDVLQAAAATESVHTDPVAEGYDRRNYVRTVFAAIEGSTHGMKRVILHHQKFWRSKLDADHLEFLTDATGKRFPSFRDNIKSTFKLFAKIHGFACQANFRCNGWSALVEAAEIRDRLMHPKSSRDLDVSRDDLAKIQEAADWYFETRNQLVEQGTNELKKGIRE